MTKSLVAEPRIHVSGVPAALAAAPLRTFRTRDARSAYASPEPQLARLARRGVLLRMAHGYWTVVPQEYVGSDWRPTMEAVSAGIARATYGELPAPLMGVSAARLHGALARALSTAIVAAPAQHEPIPLIGRPGQLQFIKRATARLDTESVLTELGRVLVTSIEQTVLDLARRPRVGVAEDQVPEAIAALLAQAEPDVLDDLAAQQRLRSALDRARAVIK